eukprot:TRINITY_DN15311_c0_g1_i1.p1 TRINITY_DN15311_c0_g1~~TRINITY_DN15311_c0_g1_i1.p1  ORF type:complete len:196 (+),score=22.39 TRINITY_DN15311_c0_g1_i1:101-688(+)
MGNIKRKSMKLIVILLVFLAYAVRGDIVEEYAAQPFLRGCHLGMGFSCNETLLSMVNETNFPTSGFFTSVGDLAHTDKRETAVNNIKALFSKFSSDLRSELDHDKNFSAVVDYNLIVFASLCEFNYLVDYYSKTIGRNVTSVFKNVADHAANNEFELAGKIFGALVKSLADSQIPTNQPSPQRDDIVTRRSYFLH